jgi:alginate O-acetyltransferase complex protein AlgI
MAIGLGLMLGFHLPVNFNAPYKADSITEFWRRWHISLSTWLRDYLYLPLGGNRKGVARTYCNLLLTMLLGGLWHGAAWTYVAWGGYHGGMLVLERLCGKQPWYGRAPHWLRVLITFVLLLFGLVLFRAADLGEAGRYLAAMFGADGGQAPLAWSPAPWAELVLCAVITFALPTSQQLVRRTNPLFVLSLQLAFVFAALTLRAAPDNIPFLYFRF